MEYKQVLFATDFSESAGFALPYAVDLAQKYDSTLHILHIVEPIVAPVDFAWGTYNYPDIEKQVKGYVDETMSGMLKNDIPGDLEVVPHSLTGKPWREIVAFAREQAMDVIVIATHGLSGLSHAIYGSTAEKVIRKAHCPVLVIRHPDVKFEMP